LQQLRLSAKEFIYHRLFSSIFELSALLHKLLNGGELIINWGRGLKNKGNAVNAVWMRGRLISNMGEN